MERTLQSAPSRFYSFVGGASGRWCVVKAAGVTGEGLAAVRRLDIVNAYLPAVPDGGEWLLRGVTSNVRYATRQERTTLAALQPPLGRSEATCAALIPISKSAAWWELSQDERRDIFEERSAHTAIGLRYLPAVARRLHHCRDLGEPFDFLTWFEYGPADANAFEDLVQMLRGTEEWSYVEREVDIRLIRDAVE
jgi:hypothetical protein